jgi:hypothetical protein
MNEILARVNMTDITDAKELIKLQYDLQENYGISKEKAEDFVDALLDTTVGFSMFAKTLEVTQNYEKAVVSLTDALTDAADAQWDYERAIKAGDAAKA